MTNMIYTLIMLDFISRTFSLKCTIGYIAVNFYTL